jgi:hypothetical protein
MKWLGKGSSRVAMQLTPEAAQVAIDEGIAATKAGLRRLMGRIGEVSDKTVQIVRRGSAQGFRVQAPDIVRDITAEITPKLEKQALFSGDVAQVDQWNKQFINDHPGLIDPVKLHEIKQTSDRVAKPIWNAIERGEVVSPGDQLWATWHRSISDWARDKLGGRVLADGTRVGGLPGGLAQKYADMNARQSGLIRLKDEAWPVVTRAEKGGVGSQVGRRMSGYQVGRVGGAMATGGLIGGTHGNNWEQHMMYGLLGSAAGGLVMSPQILSQLALILANPAVARSLGFGLKTSAAAATAPENQ